MRAPGAGSMVACMKLVRAAGAALAALVVASCATCPEPVETEVPGCAAALVSATDEVVTLSDDKRLLQGQVDTLRGRLESCTEYRAELEAANAALSAQLTAVRSAAIGGPVEGQGEGTATE